MGNKALRSGHGEEKPRPYRDHRIFRYASLNSVRGAVQLTQKNNTSCVREQPPNGTILRYQIRRPGDLGRVARRTHPALQGTPREGLRRLPHVRDYEDVRRDGQSGLRGTALEAH